MNLVLTKTEIMCRWSIKNRFTKWKINNTCFWVYSGVSRIVFDFKFM